MAGASYRAGELVRDLRAGPSSPLGVVDVDQAGRFVSVRFPGLAPILMDPARLERA